MSTYTLFCFPLSLCIFPSLPLSFSLYNYISLLLYLYLSIYIKFISLYPCISLSLIPPSLYFYFFHIYVAIYPLYLPLTNAEMLSKKWGLRTFFFLIYQTKLLAFLISYSFRISFLWPIQSDRVICELLQGEYFSNQDLAPFWFRDTSPIPSQ